MQQGTWTIRPCPHGEASALAAALGISWITASVLVRRGYGDPEQARAFLAAEPPRHDPALLGDTAAACDRIRAAIAAGERICVHGDYDVDGICATTLAVTCLRELGANVDWHLPSRFDEGYGVSGQTIERLADEGYKLVLTVDCGITAVEEVARAKALGLDVIVTDHHRPGPTLPDCPIVATRPSRYPFPELCGTGVVYKLLGALGADVDRHLDLVALATIADVVPLLDENRALASAGLRALARTQKPGLQALMRAASVDPARVDTGAVGFRLAPRINAAGRLGHPGAALELLLTDDRDEAFRLASRLEELNRERQMVEERIVREAVAKVNEWPETRPAAPRLRARRRGLARGRDRHRRVAARRALQPARGDDRRRRRGMERIGPLRVGVRPPRWTRRVGGAPRALRRAPRCGRALDPSGERRRVRARVRRARRGAPRRGGPPAGHVRRRGPPGSDRARRSSSARSSRSSRRSASATPR